MRFEGYGSLERDLGDERGLCWRMNGEEEKNWGYTTLGLGTAVPTLARAVPTF